MELHQGHSQFKKGVKGPWVPWKAFVRKRATFFTHHLLGKPKHSKIHENMYLIVFDMLANPFLAH